ncbi:hypothetical protein BDV25DRAFT_138097 [Aspergillus avenaceus]|uniref:Uncharacterized protein n=1 Tax=Aspergillus avenaceus TaxID=36643 RepID=A0A5N6U125_ASPAV|nr:hypothetical protein BDV25DRAFT_138097 [Aspergillus avenaceus]
MTKRLNGRKGLDQNQNQNRNQSQNQSQSHNQSESQRQTQTTENATCEFTYPCTAASAGSAKRKVISHIFGRNKRSTRSFPGEVWVHYCRQHYQRARYRVEWPFTQCDMLLVVLGRMEGWGGVREWEVVLRKREVERLRALYGGVLQGRRRRVVGGGGEGCEDDLDESGSGSSSGSVGMGRGEEGEEEERHQRRKPTVVTSPVPEWLLQEVGAGKSFAELRALVRRLKLHMAGLRENGASEQIVFPDIEFMPTFQAWVQPSVRPRQAPKQKVLRKKGKGSRVSRKGAVKKT